MTIAIEPARSSPAGRGRPPAARNRPGVTDAIAVGAPAVLALALCLYGLGARSLGFDEGATVAIASGHGSALAHAIAHDGGNMSLYYLLLHALIALFGDGLWVVRLPSALATALTVTLSGLLALRMFDRRVALVAGLLTAVSLPLVFWGQSARGYALMVALATGSMVAFEALIARRRHPASAWVAYAACTTLAIYTGFVAVLIVPAQLAVLTALARAGRAPRATLVRVGAGMVVAAVCCVPLVVLAASRGSGQLFWVPRPTLNIEGQVLESVASAGLAPSFHTTSTTLVLLGLTGVVLAALACTRPPGAGLLFAWVLVPVVLAWLESLVGQPIFIARNLLIAVPAVSILLAVALGASQLPKLLGGLLLVAFVILRVLQLTAAYGVSPEDWHSASAYVVTHSRSGDCVAFYPSDGRMTFGYYIRPSTRTPRSILPSARWTTPSRPYVEDYATIPAGRLERLPAQCPRLWLVSSHQGQADGPAGARANLARFQRLRAALERRYAGHRSATFGYAATITVERLSRPVAQGRSVIPTKVR